MSNPFLSISEDAPPLSAVDFLTGRGFITGKSGSGKSNTASVLIEEMLSAGFAVLVVDTDGEYYGLKEEYEVLHVGADETCDLQVGPEHAEKLAQLVLRQNVPVILDVSAYLDEAEASALIRETCQVLYQMEHDARKPLPIFVEEVHEYLPEGAGLDDVGQVLIRIAKRGRKRGLGFCGISQRPADVKKDFITQCDYLFWHRLTWDNDTAVVRRVVSSEAAGQVPDLADGEALLTADFLEEGLQRVQVRRKHTFDAGATPDLGEAERPALKSLSGSIVEELEEISRREHERKDELEKERAENERLRGEINALEEELERQQDVTQLAERFTSALERSGAGGEAADVQGEVREALEETRRELRQVTTVRDDLQEDLGLVRQRIGELEDQVADAKRLERFEQHRPEMEEAVERLAAGLGMELDGTTDKVRSRAQRLAEQVEDLKAQLEEHGGSGPPIAPSVEAFVQDPIVQERIGEAKEQAPERYVTGIIRALRQSREAVTYERVATRVGIKTTSHISGAAKVLEEKGVVNCFGRPREIEFNLSGLAEIHQDVERAERADSLIADL